MLLHVDRFGAGTEQVRGKLVGVVRAGLEAGRVCEPEYFEGRCDPAVGHGTDLHDTDRAGLDVAAKLVDAVQALADGDRYRQRTGESSVAVDRLWRRRLLKPAQAVLRQSLPALQGLL